jgi:hypothetical protein
VFCGMMSNGKERTVHTVACRSDRVGVLHDDVRWEGKDSSSGSLPFGQSECVAKWYPMGRRDYLRTKHIGKEVVRLKRVLESNLLD